MRLFSVGSVAALGVVILAGTALSSEDLTCAMGLFRWPPGLWDHECTTLTDQRIVLEGPAFNTLQDCYRAKHILIRSTWRSTDERLSEELDRHYPDAEFLGCSPQGLWPSEMERASRRAWRLWLRQEHASPSRP